LDAPPLGKGVAGYQLPLSTAIYESIETISNQISVTSIKMTFEQSNVTPQTLEQMLTYVGHPQTFSTS
jgi:hypothetical protein